MSNEAPQRMEFKTELKQLLDLIVHSLYTRKEIFLRELISNAADAIDKVRFEALTQHDLLQGDSAFKIKIIPDEKAGTLTISDNGIGMSQEAAVENLGTIAKSGTRAFLETLKEANVQQRPELIGQFGVGFYASFMAADKVTVISRPAGSTGSGVKWESDGQGQYTVEAIEKPSRGTDVILQLREDAREFLSPWTLREIVKRYSDFIDHPIVMDSGKEQDGKKEVTEETLNSRQAIWLRPRHEITPEQYTEFYQQLSRDSEPPLKTIHLAAEGATEFRALLFVPQQRGMEWMMGPEKKSNVDLYVRRVLIAHNCEELIPSYLRFIRGVVDSADLPLNVSRETLQHNPLLVKIKSNVVNRVLKGLEEMKNEEYDNYSKFFAEFREVLKEGVGQDYENRERIANLLLFESTKTEAGDEATKFTTLAKYVEAMPSTQKEIYYLIGESRQLIEHSPYLEGPRAAGHEVLLLTDPIDEYVVSSLGRYGEKVLKAVDRGKLTDEAAPEAATVKKFQPLLERLKTQIGAVKDVRLSARLKESAACLVAEEGAMSAHMERLMQRMGRGSEAPPSQRILELNPAHPVVEALLAMAETKADDSRITEIGRLLYDQAVVAEGNKITDPSAFAERLNSLMLMAVK